MTRIVKWQTPANIEPLVKTHLEEEFAKLRSKNVLAIKATSEGMPWVTNYKDLNYEAASRATEVRPFFLLLYTSLREA